jgi:hypothetical protein
VPSRNNSSVFFLFITCFLLPLTLAAAAPGAGSPPASQSPTVTKQQIDAALTQLRADPNLGGSRKARRLKWLSNDKKTDKPDSKPSAWLDWLADAINWVATTARLLLWVLGVIVVGILGLFIKRYLTTRVPRSTKLEVTMPTHVRDLDIRPESLPDDIPAATRELWDRGELRAALSLLYRGALSRLAHVHSVPILDSSTEGDCLELANTTLPAVPAAYVARLIRIWQRAVYGNSNPTQEEIQALCAGIASALDRPAALATEQAA